MRHRKTKIPVAPYMIVTEIQRWLTLRLHASSLVRHGKYRVLFGARWIEVEGAEVRVSTGGGALLKIELRASGEAAEHLLRLEAEFTGSGGVLTMETAEGRAFEVAFSESRGLLHLYGTVLQDHVQTSFLCRVRFGDQELEADAYAHKPDDDRGLVLELSASGERALIRASLAREPMTVEVIRDR